jgi:hypothetical protein
MDLIESNIGNPIEHWYYKHKFWFIKTADIWERNTEISLVDIGAGSAVFSKELLRQNFVSRCVAVDTGYVEDSEDTDFQLSYRRKVAYAGFTHFLLTDVLEHIERDERFLSEVVSDADQGSVFVITVPAIMSLWSNHDVYLKHFRRYTKLELCSLVKIAGLEVVDVRYTYSTVFPIAYLSRKISYRTTGNSQLKQNNWFTSLVIRLLLFPDRWISRFPFGVSLFMVAKKAR